jgi:hypothetical protein
MNTKPLSDNEPLAFDQQIVCVECHATFLFTSNERAWFSDQGYRPPKRCRPCRRIKRQRYWDIERAALR